MSLPELWPHQIRAIQEIETHVANGVRRILLTSPTGGGKSRIIYELIGRYLAGREWRSVVYSNRKMLVEQLRGTLARAGLPVGVRAAGKHNDDSLPIQVSSIQTEDARVYKRKGYLKWELHPANVVFIDEAHLQSGREEKSVAARIKRDHHAAGAVIIEVTATPIDLDGKAEVLVVAGTNSELRECGALVPALHFGPDEPDLRHIGLTEITKTDDLSEAKQRRVMGAVEKGEPNVKLQRLFGRVFEWYKVLNPDNRPSILFAPGVAESRWFAQEFSRQGVKAAHIDGDEVWLPDDLGGADFKADDKVRAELMEMSRDGTVRVLCNRFVLREGIDCPWLGHGIFATPFGSLQSYLQSGGRLLRSHPSISSVTIQDHGGNWWRHGSLNADREWPLGCTANVIRGQREDSLRDKNNPDSPKEPLRCPKCSAIMMSLRCVCGFTIDARSKFRPVVQENGSLIRMEGDIFRPRRVEMRSDTLKLWERTYWRARRADMTFRQAIGLFYHENGYWPPDNLKNMPIDRDHQWYKIVNVAQHKLIGEAA